MMDQQLQDLLSQMTLEEKNWPDVSIGSTLNFACALPLRGFLRVD